jgi:uncharacterized protein YecE (DUF72 family)
MRNRGLKSEPRRAKLYVGTSGWTYRDWRGRFYPEDLPSKDWLSWYAQQFISTEINGSFYRTPSIEAVESWRDRTPSHFRFAWKASKFENSIELMVSRLVILGQKCGPVLFQLPAHFRAHEERLAGFLRMLPRSYRYAFEFRHASWYDEDILRLLRKHKVSVAISRTHALSNARKVGGPECG